MLFIGGFFGAGTSAAAATAPAAPSGNSANAVSTSRIDQSWTDNSDDEDDFQAQRALNSGFTSGLVTVVKSAGSTSHSWTGLTDDTLYYTRVRARNAAGSSVWSNTASATTLQNVPAAPSSLVATTVSASQVDLAWTDNASNEDGFKVYRDAALFDTVATPNLTSYSATGLAEGTSYDWVVRAYNASGTSAASNTDTAATQLATPGSVTLCTPDGGTTVRVRWNDQSNQENNYEIFQNGVSYDTVAANVELYEDTAIAGDKWKVRAIAAALPDSDFTAERTVPTPTSNLTGCPS